MAPKIGDHLSLVEERLADFDAQLATSEETAQALSIRLDLLMAAQEEHAGNWGTWLGDLEAEVVSLKDVFKDNLKTLNEELSLVKRTLSNSSGALDTTRVKVSELKPFGRASYKGVRKLPLGYSAILAVVLCCPGS
ncbi:hypothetical protein AMTR_s00116p00087210 [Amborella trichopoda]|uniref:Uncharacterized protein n=1 Tax=Amborella trichopoda TaxID=13333 RepID=W1NPX4_AMBTC|nr:hypothetical protein AMTR_s00116p00087210 [Amborella trichopoda]